FDSRCSSEGRSRFYECARREQNKIRPSISCRLKNKAVTVSDTEKCIIGKIDNVKTSPNRQVKAQPLRIFFRSILPFLLFFLRNVNAAEEPSLSEANQRRMDDDLIVVNGNVYTVNDKQPHAEAIAV